MFGWRYNLRNYLRILWWWLSGVDEFFRGMWRENDQGRGLKKRFEGGEILLFYGKV